jgi:hypothetical protein
MPFPEGHLNGRPTWQPAVCIFLAAAAAQPYRTAPCLLVAPCCLRIIIDIPTQTHTYTQFSHLKNNHGSK